MQDVITRFYNPHVVRGILRRFLSARAVGPATEASFDHAAAQQFELEHAKQTIRETYPNLLASWRQHLARGERWHSADDNEWFQGDVGLWRRFEAHVEQRKCLEIGSGPFGFIGPATWLKDRVVIDPLVDAYLAHQLELCGYSWFTDVRTIAAPAEELVADLVGAVDGCIVCRNALDHCEDPLGVLDVMAQYAAPGCWLLLWTDIWHLQGLDAGHHNITRSVRVMDKLLEGLGFDIVRAAAPVRNPIEYMEYGRLATKR
jgi:hypothetical protein